ncbi:DUF397 domain-containing protein [Streptomyces sp. NPDC001834]|uniref:DUF397 domain-containing protein n=1 Tax=Streptomyces sp. NPDC001834 TaxID=3364616 RepID=UPI0036BB3D83
MTRNAPGSDGFASEWIKSSYSSNDGPECVEVAVVPGVVRVRDSKDVRGPQIGFRPDSWAEFVAYASAH